MTDRPDTLAQTIRDGLQNSHSATLCALADDALNELLRLLEQRTQERDGLQHIIDCEKTPLMADVMRERFEWKTKYEHAEERVRELEAALEQRTQESDRYRIEADCGMRDFDALELEHGLLQERVRELEAALADCNRRNRPEGET